MVAEWSDAQSVDEMYGEWDYATAVSLLERSLGPRPPSSLFDALDSVGLEPDDTVLDIGGRDARHSLTIAERFGVHVVCVDPVTANIDRAKEAIGDHDSGHLVTASLGSIESIPVDEDSVSLVFSRDMLTHVVDFDIAFAECGRVLRPDGRMVIHSVFATELLEPHEAAQVCADTAALPKSMSVTAFEAAMARQGFNVDSLDVVGSEWHEASQEAGTVPNYLLQVARLRRDKDRFVEEMGEFVYRAMYGNALWSIYQLIGKLESRVYTLRRS